VGVLSLRKKQKRRKRGGGKGGGKEGEAAMRATLSASSRPWTFVGLGSSESLALDVAELVAREGS
jgi:hypothetical protein